MRQFIFTTIIALISFSGFSQVHTLKGKIIDQNSNAPIAYTNIGIEGTFFGTASDADGFFELKIPDEYKTAKMYFSAVGYENKITSVSELLGRDFVTIRLKEQTYGIEGIDVAAQSKVLFRIIRTASERISENYPAKPFNMKVYYSEIQNGKTREAVAELYDENAYSNPSVLDAYKSRKYKFSEAKRDFEVYSFPQGTTGFDELLEADIARMKNTILNPKLINDYDLQLEKSMEFNGDSVWVIAYKTNKTDLPHTGDYYAKKFNGKIYISKSDYGIIRNEIIVESSKQSEQGRSLATKNENMLEVHSNIVAGYKKVNGKYVLSIIESKKQFTNAKKQKLAINQALTVLNIETNNVKKIASRDYFENVKLNETFWNNFVKPEK